MTDSDKGSVRPNTTTRNRIFYFTGSSGDVYWKGLDQVTVDSRVDSVGWVRGRRLLSSFT